MKVKVATATGDRTWVNVSYWDTQNGELLLYRSGAGPEDHPAEIARIAEGAWTTVEVVP
jgi:hypothetical protein